MGRLVNWELDYAVLDSLDTEYKVPEIWEAERAVVAASSAKNPRHGLACSAFT